MGQFRDWLNEARDKSVPTEYRIALGQLKRMYNPGEVPSEKELEKDVEIIAKKNHLDAEKFLEFAKGQFKMNEAKAKFKVGDWVEIKKTSERGEITSIKNDEVKLNDKFWFKIKDIQSFKINEAKMTAKEFIEDASAYVKNIEHTNPKDSKLFNTKVINRLKEKRNKATDNAKAELIKAIEELSGKLDESAVGTPGRTTIKDAEDHINDELVAEFKKIIKKLGGKTVAKVLLDKLGAKPEIKDEIEHIEDIIDNSNY